ncbi:MAG: hypothetical protein JKY52_09320 [Flavobacteriales bacterium]|nr:hypothetical protein [Flavobacteriales bacterium]
MVVKVDPFLYPIPPEFLKDPEVRAWFEYDNRWKHDIWLRTGGGDDAVAESQIGELYEPGIQTSSVDELAEDLEVAQEMAAQMIDLIERVEELEAASDSSQLTTDGFETINISAGVTAFTATGKQIITCNNTGALDLTLNPAPDDAEELHIKRNASGAVNFIGTIDGITTENIGSTGDGIHLIYTIAQGEWGAS